MINEVLLMSVSPNSLAKVEIEKLKVLNLTSNSSLKQSQPLKTKRTYFLKQALQIKKDH